MKPCDNWYHCTVHTYGSWLRGDKRGWRSRHHREHVDGDYKNPPPPGAFVTQRQQSKRLLKRPPVVFTPGQRRVVCNAFVERLTRIGCEVWACCVAAQHLHVLVRFPSAQNPGMATQNPGMAIPGLCDATALRDGRDPVPRHAIGLAKKHSAFVLRDHGLTGGAWARRSHIGPIESEEHLRSVIEYICNHEAEDGEVFVGPEANRFVQRG